MTTKLCRDCAIGLQNHDYVSAQGWCTSCHLTNMILEAVPRGGCVLDIGSGLATYHKDLHSHVNGDMALLDAHLPYMIEHRPPVGVPLIVGKAEELLPAIREGVFDVCLAIDFVEHLETEDAVKVIAEMQRIARRVVIFTPNGFQEQTTDSYKLGGDHWQTHRSAWTQEALERLGFSVEVWRGFHSALQNPDVLWAIWNAS